MFTVVFGIIIWCWGYSCGKSAGEQNKTIGEQVDGLTVSGEEVKNSLLTRLGRAWDALTK